MLDQQIAEIRDLRQKREQLLARMRVIQELQGNRPVIVRVFDELVRTLAKGVYFTSMKLDGHYSRGRRHRRVEQPDFVARCAISKRPTGSRNRTSRASRKTPTRGAQASNFQLTVVQTSPKKPAAAEGEE